MILTTLLHVFLVLSGIVLLTLMYFLAVRIASSNGSDAKNGGDASGSDNGRPTEGSKRAVIRCNVIPPSVPVRYPTLGYTDCRTQNRIFNGNLVCEHGCLGLGSCVRICPNDAIVLRKGRVYITDVCTGCGFCVDVCPKHLIQLVPVTETGGISCAACGRTDASAWCSTAADGYLLDFQKLP